MEYLCVLEVEANDLCHNSPNMGNLYEVLDQIHLEILYLMQSNLKKVKYELGLFGMLKLALALQFIVTNAYFSVACNTKISVHNNELQR